MYSAQIYLFSAPCSNTNIINRLHNVDEIELRVKICKKKATLVCQQIVIAYIHHRERVDKESFAQTQFKNVLDLRQALQYLIYTPKKTLERENKKLANCNRK